MSDIEETAHLLRRAQALMYVDDPPGKNEIEAYRIITDALSLLDNTEGPDILSGGPPPREFKLIYKPGCEPADPTMDNYCHCLYRTAGSFRRGDTSYCSSCGGIIRSREPPAEETSWVVDESPCQDCVTHTVLCFYCGPPTYGGFRKRKEGK